MCKVEEFKHKIIYYNGKALWLLKMPLVYLDLYIFDFMKVFNECLLKIIALEVG